MNRADRIDAFVDSLRRNAELKAECNRLLDAEIEIARQRGYDQGMRDISIYFAPKDDPRVAELEAALKTANDSLQTWKKLSISWEDEAKHLEQKWSQAEAKLKDSENTQLHLRTRMEVAEKEAADAQKTFRWLKSIFDKASE